MTFAASDVSALSVPPARTVPFTSDRTSACASSKANVISDLAVFVRASFRVDLHVLFRFGRDFHVPLIGNHAGSRVDLDTRGHARGSHAYGESAVVGIRR